MQPLPRKYGHFAVIGLLVRFGAFWVVLISDFFCNKTLCNISEGGRVPCSLLPCLQYGHRALMKADTTHIQQINNIFHSCKEEFKTTFVLRAYIYARHVVV